MSVVQKIAATVLLALLVLVGYGLWATHSSTGRGSRAARHAAPAGSLTIDQTVLQTAQKLAQEATFTSEKEIAQQVVQAADHDLDISFAVALRRIEAHPPVLTAEAQKIEARLNSSQKLLEADQASLAQLTAALAQAQGSQRNSLQDQLNLVQSQLELDQDEVEETDQELIEAGGNVHQRIQSMMQLHAASEQKPAPVAATPDPLANLRGLARRIRHLLSMRDRRRDVDEAGAAVADSLSALESERQELVATLDKSKASVPQLAKHTRSARAGGPPDAATPATGTARDGGAAASSDGGTATAAATATVAAANAVAAPSGHAAANTVAAPSGHAAANTTAAPSASSTAGTSESTGLLTTTRQIAADQRVLTLLDQRIATRKDLDDLYSKWSALLATRSSNLLHSALIDVAVVLGILVALLFLDRWLERLFGRTKLDRRQISTLRTVTRVALQVVGIVAILLVAVGLPGQLGTFLGIVGAGLTVALKDFIVAFIGWIVLMGRNGMRLGDWVEINGVSGEVVDLGMFHTVLLETGNWSGSGHPTGRRVTFTNSFAIQKHYFNFSTSGQWLWDEVLVLVPYDRDPHVIADAIHKEVLAATEETSRQAEREWRRAVRSQRETTFSAEPGILIRPATGGVEVAVRYVTRASDRFQLRTRLYQTAVQMLSRPPSASERLQVTTRAPSATA